MNIVLSFIGKFPNYIIDSVHQIRCFTSSSIYLILDDIQSPHISSLLKYNVNIIYYNDVIDEHFLTIVNNNFSKFLIISDLHFPYQNNEAIILALDYGKEKKVDCIVASLIPLLGISRGFTRRVGKNNMH
jgi:hypothetical protein